MLVIYQIATSRFHSLLENSRYIVRQERENIIMVQILSLKVTKSF